MRYAKIVLFGLRVNGSADSVMGRSMTAFVPAKWTRLSCWSPATELPDGFPVPFAERADRTARFAEGERNLRNRLDRPDVVVRLAVVGYVSRRFGSAPDECTGTRNDESCRARSDGRKNVYGIYGQQSVR